MRYTEAQISSELLDQPVFTGEPKKLFICSTPRSGSYLLCRHMINAGVGVPHEYFNPIIMRQMAPRFGLGGAVEGLQWRRRGRRDRLPIRNPVRVAEEAFLGRYLAELVPRRCQGGVFAAKIHFDQFTKVLDNPTGRALLAGGVFVHLYRENLLKQAVSGLFATMTGRWGIDDARTTTPLAHDLFYDTALLDRIVQALAEEDLGWRVFLARNGLAALSISYEHLCKDPFSFVVTVAEHLGLDPSALRAGYSEAAESGRESDPELPSRSEVARRYVAAVRALPDIRSDAGVSSAAASGAMKVHA